MKTNLKLEKLKEKLSALEDKLYTEKLKQHEKLSRMGWGHAMRNIKCSISTTREDRLKERIKEIKEQIQELQN